MDTLGDVLITSERCVRELSSSRGRTSPPQHGVAPRRLGEALCLAWHYRRGWLWISLIRRSVDKTWSIPHFGEPFCGAAVAGTWPSTKAECRHRGGRPPGPWEWGVNQGPTCLTNRQIHEAGQDYGIGRVSRTSTILLSRLRCVSKRSPMSKDVITAVVRPVRLYTTG